MRINRRSPAPLLAIPAVMAMVWSASNAAFSGATATGNNSFSAGTVSLSTNESTELLFDVDNLIPGKEISKCINVEYTGSSYDVTPVKMFGSVSSEGDLASVLNLRIESVSGSTAGSFGDCSSLPNSTKVYEGSLTDFAGSHKDFSSGTQGDVPWTPTAEAPHAHYRFIVGLDPLATNSVQGDVANAVFNWAIESLVA